MQTPAERRMITVLRDALNAKKPSDGSPLTVLNVGAGTRTIIEDAIHDAGQPHLVDRADVVDCTVKHPDVRTCIHASAEDMHELKDTSYDLTFANYVLEHIPNLNNAIREVRRVLKPGGMFALTISNPIAPEFVLAKYTPLAFHQKIKGEGAGHEAFETYYNYNGVGDLIKKFEAQGFKLKEDTRYACTYCYMHRFIVLNWLALAYDAVVNVLHLKPIMGQVCLVFEKA